jgi:hypothetical protein
MTDEERQKLCDKLRVYGKSSFHGGRACKEAADEIERLAARVNALEHIINLDMYEADKNRTGTGARRNRAAGEGN